MRFINAIPMYVPRLLGATALFTASLLAQDPPAPPGGFAIKSVLNQLITYSDGYKTRVDVRYPDFQAPSTGWPAFMVFHGGGGNRKKSWVAGIAERMARFGYATIAYDTGGNGDTVKLNPNSGRRDEDLRVRDIAEMFAQVESQLTSLMDEKRFCCMGKSGGGKHTLWAVSYSGKKLPRTGAVTHMPVVTCAHCDIQVLDFPPDHLPGGNMMKAVWATAMYEGLGPTDPLVQRMIAHDFGYLDNYVKSPQFGHFPGLEQSDIPLVVSYAWDDAKHFVNVNGDFLARMKPGVPRRYVLITGGHASAGNDYAVNVRRDYTQRWCDRFAKGIKNGIDIEPFAEASVIPARPKDYQNRKTQWKHRWSEKWPPTTPLTRYYLRGNGKLDPSPPTSTEGGPTIRHRVAAGYGMLEFMKDKGAPQAVMQKIPPVGASFDLATAAAPVELFGRCFCTAYVTTNNRSFQLQAALLDVPPSGSPRFITSGVAAKWQVAPGRHRLDIVLGDVAYVLPKGHTLRLSLENLNMRRHPGNMHLFAAPYFENVDMAVQIDPAYASRLDLALRQPPPSLTPRLDNVFASQGISHQLRVNGETARAGRPYMVLVSGSGVAPGITLPPRIPLNIDIWTSLGISLLNTPVFASFFGVLDGQGRAAATFALPPIWATPVAGTRLSFAALVFEQNGGLSVTHPAELVIYP